MLIYVYDDSLVRIGVIDCFKSLEWRDCFFSFGEFELCAAATEKNVSIIKKHFFLERDDCGLVGFISEINISADKDGNEFITAKGCSAEGLLKNRIVYDTSGSSFIDILRINASDCSDLTRNFPHLSFEDNFNLSGYYAEGMKFARLSDFAQAVCTLYGCGLKAEIIHGNSANTLLISVFKGTDRSVLQSVIPHVILSEDYGSVIDCDYNYSEKKAVSTVYGHAYTENDVSGVPPEWLEGDDFAGFSRLETSRCVNAKTFQAQISVFAGYDAKGSPIYNNETRQFINNYLTLKLIKEKCAQAVAKAVDCFSGNVCFAEGLRPNGSSAILLPFTAKNGI